MLINDVTHQAMAFGLSGSNLRAQALAQNVANISTPGYRRVDVSFQSQLQTALADARETGKDVSLRPTFEVDRAAAVRVDGNAVDVDQENALVAENALYHQGLTSLMGAHRRMLETAMRTSGV